MSKINRQEWLGRDLKNKKPYVKINYKYDQLGSTYKGQGLSQTRIYIGIWELKFFSEPIISKCHIGNVYYKVSSPKEGSMNYPVIFL